MCTLGLLSHVLVGGGALTMQGGSLAPGGSPCLWVEGLETPGLGAKHTTELWAKAFWLPVGTAGHHHLVAGGLPCLF